MEGENAPAGDVAAVIKKVYEEVKGDLLVASRSNKVHPLQSRRGALPKTMYKQLASSFVTAMLNTIWPPKFCR